MKRILEGVCDTNWYHFKTLEKYFINAGITKYLQKNKNNIDFEFVTFQFPWTSNTFIVHPKTKRLRLVTMKALKEIGFYD